MMLSRRSFILAAAVLSRAVFVRAQQSGRAGLDDFIDLSQRLLRRTNLDRETAQVYLDALNADTATAVTLAYVIQSNGNPTPEQAVLAATIVEWWNTGVYQIHGESRLVAHRLASSPAPYPRGVESSLGPPARD
jgi:hypothetical protein